MTPVSFPQCTHVVGANQPEYSPLPAHINAKEQSVPFTCCFELSEAEIAELKQTKKLWFTQLTFNKGFQPIRLSTQNPFENSATESTDKVIEPKRIPEDLIRLIHEQVGAASMCWELPEKAGVFQSERASEVAKTICEAVEKELNK